jgi:Domain of unknown function (DUF4136)
MKKLRTILGLVLPVLLVVSCAAPAYVEKDSSADFSRYHTYAWVDNKGKDGKNRFNDFMDNHVHDAVAGKLQKEGWKEDRRNPDILLSYDLLVEKTSREINNPVYSQPYSRIFYNPFSRRYGRIFYPSTFLGYDNDVVTQREGTLTLTMLDARTDKTVWQGWTTDEVSSRHVTKKEIQSSVNSIFRKFDVVRR